MAHPARTRTALLLCALALALVNACRGQESHTQRIIDDVIALKNRIEQSPTCAKGCTFLSAWDFDGTVLHGDATEGLKVDGRVVYPGLEQLGIEAGLSRIYARHEFPRFWRDYETMDQTRGHTIAYSYLPQVFAGARVDALVALADQHYARVLQPHYFLSSVQIFNALRSAGIRPTIISAAPHVFVRSAGPTLNVPREDIFGIETAVEGGRLTKRIVPPITYAQGKAQRLQQIVQAAAGGGRPVFVLAGFGNSYHTDGDFLLWIIEQKLPVGTPLAVMINGGTQAGRFAGRFLTVTQTQVLGPHRSALSVRPQTPAGPPKTTP